MKSRAIAIAFAIVAAIASFTMLAGCGGSPTLEQYFNDHEEQWTEVQDQVKNMAGEMFALSMDVKDNQINQVMTYTETFPEESLTAMKEYFSEQQSALREQIASSIALIEQQTGIEGVSWTMQYNNGDGAEIFSMTVDGSEAPAAGTDDTSADVAPAATTESTEKTAAETSPAE